MKLKTNTTCEGCDNPITQADITASYESDIMSNLCRTCRRDYSVTPAIVVDNPKHRNPKRKGKAKTYHPD